MDLFADPSPEIDTRDVSEAEERCPKHAQGRHDWLRTGEWADKGKNKDRQRWRCKLCSGERWVGTCAQPRDAWAGAAMELMR